MVLSEIKINKINETERAGFAPLPGPLQLNVAGPESHGRESVHEWYPPEKRINKSLALTPMVTGFTLIEIILYIGLASFILLSVSVLLGTVLVSRVKGGVAQEIEQQGIQVMQIMTQSIRNAENILSPLPGLSESVLSLDVASEPEPIIFDVLSEAVRVSEDGSSFLPLTSSRVKVSNLTFQNVSRAGTPGVIRIKFDLSYKNPENRPEFTYLRTFYASAAIR